MSSLWLFRNRKVLLTSLGALLAVGWQSWMVMNQTADPHSLPCPRFNAPLMMFPQNTTLDCFLLTSLIATQNGELKAKHNHATGVPDSAESSKVTGRERGTGQTGHSTYPQETALHFDWVRTASPFHRSQEQMTIFLFLKCTLLFSYVLLCWDVSK